MAITTTRAATAATRRSSGIRGWRRLARAGVALVLGTIALAVGNQALDALHGEVLWLSAGQALRQGDAWAARTAAQRALERRPQDYRYLARAAAAEQALRRSSHARELWIAALAQRPGYPYPWANLAVWQLDHGGARSPELEYSLTQALRLGGQERGLRKAFAIEALQHWNDDLPPTVRATLKTALLTEFEQNWVRYGAYALIHRQDGLLCAVLEQDKGPQKWCDGIRQVHSVCDARDSLTRHQRQWCEKMDALFAYQTYPPE